MRCSLALLATCLLLLSGCHYSSSDSYGYSVTVSTQAQPNALYEGTSSTLVSRYAVDNASVYITAEDWTVTSAPDGYVLSDAGREATFTPLGPGTYVVRYRTWYYTDWDSCYCYEATSYRETYVTVTALAAPAG